MLERHRRRELARGAAHPAHAAADAQNRFITTLPVPTTVRSPTCSRPRCSTRGRPPRIARRRWTGARIRHRHRAGRTSVARRGLDVTGIELSADMLAELRRAPGTERIHVIEGDMATTRVEGELSLVHPVFNTITNLTTQDDRSPGFINAARHLAPGGWFGDRERGFPALRRLLPGAVGRAVRRHRRRPRHRRLQRPHAPPELRGRATSIASPTGPSVSFTAPFGMCGCWNST